MAKRKRPVFLTAKRKRSRSRSTPQEIIVEELVPKTKRSQLEDVIVAEATEEIHHTLNIEDTVTEDAILCSIISSLPLREAVRTSVLSPRWRNLWTNLPVLKFNAANMLDADTARLVHLDNKSITDKDKFELIKRNRDQFIVSVDSVLQHRHGEARLDEFWIRYFIPKVHSHHIDAWVRFAVAAKTKQLNVQVHKPFFKEIERDPYDFPCHLLGTSSTIEILHLACCSLRPPCNFEGLRHLKALNLVYIDLLDEDFNNLLSNCHTLQSLCLWKSPRLVSLSIPHPLNQFRYLTVKECHAMREIKINASNFDRLRYWGPPVDFVLAQSSKLKYAQVFFCMKQSQSNVDFYLNKISRELPHLETLAFLINGVSEVAELPKGFNSFIHLRHLEWAWDAKMSFPFMCNVLDAAPFLKELKLRLMVRVVEPPLPGLSELRKMLPKHPRTHLKTIEITGFYFDQWQIEVALYLLSNATELETMTIQKGRTPPAEIDETDKKNFDQEVPTNVKLVVL